MKKLTTEEIEIRKKSIRKVIKIPRGYYVTSTSAISDDEFSIIFELVSNIGR